VGGGSGTGANTARFRKVLSGRKRLDATFKRVIRNRAPKKGGVKTKNKGGRKLAPGIV